jgi:hypothetical protein
MVPAAPMIAAWAPQPDPLITLMGEVSRHLAQVEGWVSHVVDELIVGVCQHFFPLVVESHACDRHSEYYRWIALVHYSDARSQFLN